MTPVLVFALASFIIILIWRWNLSSGAKPKTALPEGFAGILRQEVGFYQKLTQADKIRFERKLKEFLSGVRIEGIGITIEPIDIVLIGASAVIPIFGFADWYYSNLSSVLLYPDTFNEDFEIDGGERPVMGMVGSGAMNRQMILSQKALREGFKNTSDKNNTGIHEFVHLLDKSDGDADGIPENLLAHQYTIPWINLMREQIEEIKNHHSDINPYGATNKAEFFAVAAEYFFERPDLLHSKHPELFSQLEKIFKQTPGV